MAFTGSSPLATTYSDSISPEVAVTIEAFAEAIRPAINYALLFTIFASMLIPILITLLWFSTPTTRRQPIFILNVASILVGIGIAMFGDYSMLFGVSNPTIQMSGSTSTAFIVILLLSPWVAELVLVFRLAIVFPPRRTPLSKLAAVSAFPVVVKCARLGCLASFWKVFVRETTQYSGALTETENIGWQQFPYIRATCLLQLFDDAYLSTNFIWKLYGAHIFQGQDSQRVTFGAGGSLASRLRTLFWIAVGNFVFPVIFNIALTTVIFVDPQYTTLTGNLFITDYYLSIIGVVFATLWSTSTAIKKDESIPLTWQLGQLPETASASTKHSNADRAGLEPPSEELLQYAPDKTYNSSWSDIERPKSRREAVPPTVLVQVGQPQQ